VVGANSDAEGFARALAVEGLKPPPAAHALVLGAGGAAAAVCLALARLGAARITVCARRVDSARALAHTLSAFIDVVAAPWSSADLDTVLPELDIAVNATPVSISLLPFHPRELPASCTVADVRYAPAPVDVVSAARDSGHRGCDGREMLLQQALLSFERWTGMSPPPAVGRAALARSLG